MWRICCICNRKILKEQIGMSIFKKGNNGPVYHVHQGECGRIFDEIRNRQRRKVKLKSKQDK